MIPLKERMSLSLPDGSTSKVQPFPVFLVIRSLDESCHDINSIIFKDFCPERSGFAEVEITFDFINVQSSSVSEDDGIFDTWAYAPLDDISAIK